MRSAVIGTIALCAAASPANADTGTGQARVTASVPESCRLEAPTISLDPGTRSSSGFAWEACNSQRSYEIAATTRSLASDERLVVTYGTRSARLEADGSTVIARRNGPVFMRVPMGISAERLAAPVTLNVSMTAI